MADQALRVLLEANHVGDAQRGVGVYAQQLGTALARRDDIRLTYNVDKPARR